MNLPTNWHSVNILALLVRLGWTGDSQLSHAELQGGPLHSQPGCGAVWSGEYPVALFEYMEDMPPFHFLQCHHAIATVVLHKPRLQVRDRYLKFFARRQNYSALYYVLQLANIPGPWITDEGIHRFRRYRVNPLLHQAGKMLGKVPDQEGDILGSFAQRRHVNGKNI